MTESWTNEEMKTTDLDDQRLNERLEDILEAFAARPNISIPAAMSGQAELEAAYRFCDKGLVHGFPNTIPYFSLHQPKFSVIFAGNRHKTTEKCLR
jgi:hypothetical protein